MKRTSARDLRGFVLPNGDVSGGAPARGRLQTHRMRIVRGLRLIMANTKKAKDPTEVALSAIQEALNISEPNPDTSRNAPPVDLDVPPPPPVTSSAPSFEPAF